MRDRFNTLYRKITDVCDKVSVTNPGEITLLERLIDMEYIVHTKIYQMLQDLQSVIYSFKEILQKIDGEISISAGGGVERRIGSIRDFN